MGQAIQLLSSKNREEGKRRNVTEVRRREGWGNRGIGGLRNG
jgi:hypothetical protein